MPASDPRQSPGFRRRLLAARLFVWAERVWPAVWPAVGVVGLFLAGSLLGLWYRLTTVPHAVLLVLFAAGLAAALWRARQVFRFSDRASGLARLERDSGVAHRPLRGLDDTLPESVHDPLTRRLWALHRERLIASLACLRLSPPRSALPARDPWALRAAVLLLLVLGLVDARGEYGSRLASAFAFVGQGSAAVPTARLDLWVTPPAYTHRPPLAAEQTREQAALTVPAGSVALAQLHHEQDGVAGARLSLGEAGADFADLGSGSAEAKLQLASSGRLVAHDARGRELGAWNVTAAPDAPPTVAFAGPSQPTIRGVLKVAYEATDDYGVAEVALLLAPAGRESEVERIGLVKPAAQPPKLATSSFTDLTANPLAGLEVVLKLEAVDGVGQKGQSEPMRIVLPAREFHHPLARAIIEQRRELARDPATAPDVAGHLAALAETDVAQKLPTSVPLSLRVAASRLSFNQSPEARREVIDLLWELALFIEDGALSVAERKLHDVQDRLQKALLEGAKDSELEKMLQELQQALDEYLDQLTRQAQEQAQNGQNQQSQQPNRQDAQTVDRQDLQQMLDQARELLRNGAKEQARQMLAQLQQMLENLRAGNQQAQQQPSPGEQALSDLQKMIQLQQQLLDRSFQMDRRQRGGQQQQGQQQAQRQQGRNGQPQQGGQPRQGDQQGDEMGQAAAEQDALRKALGELMRRLGDAGMEIPRALGQAELQMRDAKGALQNSSPGQAAESQTQAIDSMQRGGQAMMDQLREQLAQQQGNGQQGDQPAPMPGGRRGRDPLGRATRNDGGYDTRDVQVPEQGDLGKARDVLEELYRRAGDQRRPPAELDYYRRLLDRF